MLLLAVAYVAVLAWQAPHTVHHFFEPEVEKHNECALGAAADRSAGTAVELVPVDPTVTAWHPVGPVAQQTVRAFAVALPATRAPPSPGV